MAHAVFKWYFTTPVHFGNEKGQLAESGFVLKSDTLFSALCLECLKIGGEKLLDEFYHWCKMGELAFSDALPFYGESYFLPKPIVMVERQPQEHNSVQKKLYKNLGYISAQNMRSYWQSLKNEGAFDPKAESDQLKAITTKETRVMARNRRENDEDTLPFYISTVTFAPEGGLYVIVEYQDEAKIAKLQQIMSSLGLSGIGGKKSSGLGHFEADDVIFLDDAYSEGLKALQQLLRQKEAAYYMTLSCALPNDDELARVLKGAYYKILKRGGFVDSSNYMPQFVKKKTLYLLDSGSCFKQKFAGDIRDIARGGSHNVYRYAKPLFMGVDL